jgi:hypothetical protein
MAKTIQSLAAFQKFAQKALAGAGDQILGAATGKLGFFGKSPVTRPTALTAASAATVGATYTATEQGVVNNTRTRVNELETKLKALGILP